MATPLSTPSAVRPGLADQLAALGAYLLEFARHPIAVGSPVPSFPHTVNRLLRPIDWRGIKLLIEFGPGTGTFTAEALRRMRPDATLIAIDSSEGFTGHLRKALPDARLRAVTGSAQDVERLVAEQGLDQADCIVSGLPFSTLPPGAGEEIIEASHRVLRPGGQFVAYQVRNRIRTLLERRFTSLGEAWEWRNMPPYYLYWFKKPER